MIIVIKAVFSIITIACIIVFIFHWSIFQYGKSPGVFFYFSCSTSCEEERGLWQDCGRCCMATWVAKSGKCCLGGQPAPCSKIPDLYLQSICQNLCYKQLYFISTSILPSDPSCALIYQICILQCM